MEIKRTLNELKYLEWELELMSERIMPVERNEVDRT